MKILFISRYSWPHVGGVEKHIREVSLRLRKKGHKVTIISENDIKYPHIKYIGLLYIWLWLFKNRDLIARSDLVHIHDVFIWYLPFRFLFPNKKVYTTFHGGQGIWPIPFYHKILARLAWRLSRGTVAVGDFIPKYFKIKPDKVVYGAADSCRKTNRKKEKSVIFLGRLEKETGVYEFLKWIRSLVYGYKVDFIGDGSLKKQCEEHGTVHGFCDPAPFLRKAEICVPGGYLSFLEAKTAGCKIKTFYNSPIKKDYWRAIKKKYSVSENGKKIPTWDDMVNIYLKLWGLY